MQTPTDQPPGKFYRELQCNAVLLDHCDVNVEMKRIWLCEQKKKNNNLILHSIDIMHQNYVYILLEDKLRTHTAQHSYIHSP